MPQAALLAGYAWLVQRPLGIGLLLLLLLLTAASLAGARRQLSAERNAGYGAAVGAATRQRYPAMLGPLRSSLFAA